MTKYFNKKRTKALDSRPREVPGLKHGSHRIEVRTLAGKLENRRQVVLLRRGVGIRNWSLGAVGLPLTARARLYRDVGATTEASGFAGLAIGILRA